MRKIIAGVMLLGILAGCKNQHDQALKSADKDFILKVANEYFDKGKYDKAIELYDRLPNLVAGTDDAADVVFRSAYANYHEKVYRLAGHQFKKFTVTFPQDPRVEEAAYMAALCYYKGSLDYNLDQTNTKSAIEELQGFLNNYPDSERSKNISELIDELNYKLEYKAYRNAKQYYDMAQYKAAIVAFNNVKNDFPGTSLSPKIEEYLLRSYYELAVASRYDLKADRLKQAKDFAHLVESSKTPENAKLAAQYSKRLVEEQEKFKVDEARYKAELEKIEARRKRDELRNTTKQELKTQAKNENQAVQALRDSAASMAPTPALQIPINK